MITTLLAAADPVTFQWSPKCAVVMIICNLLAYAIARSNIEKPNEGFPMPNAQFYGGLSHGSFVAAKLCLYRPLCSKNNTGLFILHAALSKPFASDALDG